MIAGEQDEGVGWAYGGAAEAIFALARSSVVVGAMICCGASGKRLWIPDDLVTTNARRPDRQKHDQQSKTRREFAPNLH